MPDLPWFHVEEGFQRLREIGMSFTKYHVLDGLNNKGLVIYNLLTHMGGPRRHTFHGDFEREICKGSPSSLEVFCDCSSL